MKIQSLPFAVALLVGALSIDSEPAFGGNQRPLRLLGSGQAAFVTDTMAIFSAEGTATHLGRWHVDGEIAITPTADPDIVAFTGTAVLTAADGDQLNVVLEGDFDLNTGHATEEWDFVGGTGRFADASGTVTGSTENSPDGSFTLFLRGTISY